MKSIKAFFIVNGVIITLGFFKYFVDYLFTDLLISGILVYFMDTDKPRIKSLTKQPDTTFYFIVNNLVKGFTHSLMINGGDINLVSLLPRYFFFEIIFDFLHYWIHRLSHIFYIFHKVHHRYSNPTTCTTFYMHPIDLLLSYSLPLFISCKIIEFSYLEFCILTVYMSYQEIAGHTGRWTYPTSSFAQCIWLPRILGIELYGEDHYLHHSRGKCNYSKRFSLWDRVFGTYETLHNI